MIIECNGKTLEERLKSLQESVQRLANIKHPADDLTKEEIKKIRKLLEEGDE